MLMSSVFQEETNRLRGWGFKDQKWYVNFQMNSFSMPFIIAASETNFYGVMANSGSNDSHSFLHFLWNIWKHIVKYVESSNKKFWIVCDNASIHKTSIIKDLIMQNELHMLTIPPYCPLSESHRDSYSGYQNEAEKKARPWKVLLNTE